MATALKVILGIIAFFVVTCGVTACSAISMYNRLPIYDEAVKRSFAQVENAYKLRADTLVKAAEIAERYASHEQKVQIDVAKARTAGKTNMVLPDNPTPEQIQKFNDAQKEIAAATKTVSDIMVNMVREAPPNLKADAQFMIVQKRLDEIEKMIRARRDFYTKDIEKYNLQIRTFPMNLIASWAGYKEKPQLTYEDAATIKESPKQLFPSRQ